MLGVRAVIQKSPVHEPYPWLYSVDYTSDGAPMDFDAYDYGNVATFEEAVDVVNHILTTQGVEILKGLVARMLHTIGGCDAQGEWAKGWDAGIGAAIGLVDALEVQNASR